MATTPRQIDEPPNGDAVDARGAKGRKLPLARFAIREYAAVVLKPQDIVVTIYVGLHPEPWTYPGLAAALYLSASEAHAAVKRAQVAGLLEPMARTAKQDELLELLLHGIKFVYPVERGALTRGMPTAHGAPPLRTRLTPTSAEVLPVWPDPEGKAQGEAWAPLYPAVPRAARRDPGLYEALALVDVMRGGRATDRAIAIDELQRRLARRG